MTIGKRIVLGFTLAIAITVGLGAFSVSGFRGVRGDAERVQTRSAGLTTMLEIRDLMRQNMANVLRLVAEDDATRVAAVEVAM